MVISQLIAKHTCMFSGFRMVKGRKLLNNIKPNFKASGFEQIQSIVPEPDKTSTFITVPH